MEHPMNRDTTSNFVLARALTAGAWGTLCAFILAPPVLAAAGWDAAATVVYFFFSPVCHQAPERSFELLGIPLAVCHRCSGIYLGLFLGSMLRNPWIHRSPAARRRWILAAAVPLVLDALLPCCGLWVNTAASRFATGLCFGIPVASLVVRGIAEFLTEAPWRRFSLGSPRLWEASNE